MKKTRSLQIRLASTLIGLFLSSFLYAQGRAENIIIITTDGLRWQEVFGGMDSALANSRRYNQGDSLYLHKQYGGETAEDRRKKLMPFFWTTLTQRGQIYGNRLYDNRVDVANPYRFSYPGYNELLTGFADEQINTNSYPDNPNLSVLEFLNRQKAYKNKVACFGAWETFNRILNEPRCGFPVIAGYDTVPGTKAGSRQQLINTMLLNSHKPWQEGECLDMFTHYSSLEYVKAHTPKVLYIAYGETDEWAHAGQYRFYLDAAKQVDQWIAGIWAYVQSHPFYRNKTALIITTDHGRGDKNKAQWTDHGSKVEGAEEIWFALLGPGITPKGEVKQKGQYFQQQLAQTIANVLGLTFSADHPVAEAVKEIW
jgi:hypothetical protein